MEEPKDRSTVARPLAWAAVGGTVGLGVLAVWFARPSGLSGVVRPGEAGSPISRLAQQVTARDSARADQILGEIQTETDEALENLRDLARGIYPPLLADQGLRTALESQGGKSPVPVEARADRIGLDASRTGYGTGLQGMADRLAVAGGELTIVSAPGVSTTIMGTVPA